LLYVCSAFFVVVFGRFTYHTCMHQSWLLWNLLHTFWRVSLHIYYACCSSQQTIVVIIVVV